MTNDYNNIVFNFTLLKETISKIRPEDCYIRIILWYPEYNNLITVAKQKTFIYKIWKDTNLDELIAASIGYIKNEFLDIDISVVYPINDNDYLEINRIKKPYNTYPKEVTEILEAIMYNNKDIINKYQEIFDKFIVEVT